MDQKQKTLAYIAGIVALILIAALLLSPPNPDMGVQWTPAAERTNTNTPGSQALRITPAARTPRPGITAAVPTAAPTIADGTPTQTQPGISATTSATTSATARGEEPKAFYVAPDGSKDNEGTMESPWELQYVLNHPDAIKPGDIIWLRGGEYRGSYVSHLEGEEGKPITVRAYPGERATLMHSDRVLDISTSHYVIFWGLEITATENSRDPINRPETAYGVRINQGKESSNIKFINMIVHDMPAQGFGWWKANSDSEIYGSLVYYNGVNQFDHGIYVHNENGTKRMVDNMIFDNASHGIHAYGKETQPLNNLYIEGNTLFNNGSIGFTTNKGVYGIFKRNILVGGLSIAENPVVIDNYTYYPDPSGESLNLGYRAGYANAIVENNYFGGGSIELVGQNDGVTMMENTITGVGPQILGLFSDTANDWSIFKPVDTHIFVRPNQYETGRANVTIYNWTGKEQVAIPAADLEVLGIKPGDTYELHNVQDYFNDIITGTYDGQQIVVPMTGRSVAQPLGLSFKPPSTFPEFGAFVLFVRSSGS